MDGWMDGWRQFLCPAVALDQTLIRCFREYDISSNARSV